MYVDYYSSPIGILKLQATEHYLTHLEFVDAQGSGTNTNMILDKARTQLDEYFLGKRHNFDLPLAPEGTEFQKQVWQALLNITHGNTASYKDIASNIGKEKASRAIGNANNRNPIAIIIPCHRVIGHDGKMVGYAGGLNKKKWLLEHENSL